MFPIDVYVFGVGDKVNKKELNDIASNKRDDRHLFILREAKTLGEVFNTMISRLSFYLSICLSVCLSVRPTGSIIINLLCCVCVYR